MLLGVVPFMVRTVAELVVLELIVQLLHLRGCCFYLPLLLLFLLLLVVGSYPLSSLPVSGLRILNLFSVIAS